MAEPIVYCISCTCPLLAVTSSSSGVMLLAQIKPCVLVNPNDAPSSLVIECHCGQSIPVDVSKLTANTEEMTELREVISLDTWTFAL